MHRPSSFAPGLLLPLLCAAALPAQTHPNFARGFEPGKAFQVGDLDSVNLFNGALTVNIPIGPTFPVGGAFSYGLTLTHASNAWEFQEHCANGDNCTAQVVPLRHFNAGHGWKVSLGEMVFVTPTIPASYRGPDGAEHRFYDRLHKGDPLQAGVWYTRDGTYLRYTAGTRKVEFPDGTVHVFDALGRLVRMEDRFGNGLTVTYGNPWVLTDSAGRRHEIHFKAGNTVDFPLVIDRVELQAFGTQANGQPNEAVYAFEYGAQPVTLRRPSPHNDGVLGPNVTVPLLTALALPEGLRYETLGYHTDWQPNNRAPGALKGLRLPTLGRLEWDYTLYQFPTGSALDPNDPKRRILTNALGVAARRVVDPIGGTIGASGTWTYSQSVVVPPGGTEQPVEMTTAVTDPLGHRTVHYFSAFYEGPTSWPAISPDYGRPYTLRQNDGASPPRYLSTQTYHAGGTLLRATWLRHERDEITAGESLRHYQELNSRVAGSRTVYHDDSGRSADTDSSDLDGLGRYRTTTTGGDFGAGDVRTAITAYLPAGTYKVDPATGLRAADSSFVTPPANARWIFGTYSESKVTEGGFTERVLTCFDPTTGFLERRRRLRNPGLGARGNDLLTAYEHLQGNVTREKLFGGDGANLLTDDSCGFTLPAPAFRLDHGWSAGVRVTSQWNGAGHLDLDLTVDPTGLPSASRDTSELSTGLEHDRLGRRTWDKPAANHGGWTEYVYTAADPGTTSPAKVLIRRRGNGSKTAPVLAESEILFDGLGRVWRERDLLPSDWSTRETRYDGAGNRAWVSERQAGNPDRATRFFNFDPFGRPGAIRPPDRNDPNDSHDVTLTYAGVRQVSRTVRIGTARNAATGAINEAMATTTEIYDRQGRLWRVTEPSGAGDANVTTTYTYDAGNRLRTVATTATVNGSQVTQDRVFDYDALGLLRSETHPEKGPAGNGAVTYASYDARGLAGRKTDGASDLTFHFDAAGRLEEIKEAGGARRRLKKWSYGTSNADLSNGRVIGSERHHYVPQGTVTITTDDQRLGRDGRVSRRDLRMKFNSTQAESFRQTFSWNPLGDLAFADYPVCTHAACQPRPAVFADVSLVHWAKPEIEAIERAGVTAGCGGMPTRYCPDANHSRAQMAVFLLVAKEGPGYQPPPCTVQVFNDIPCSDPLARWINELVARGVTAGCGNGNFCPAGTVSHGQMAVFLLRTWETGYTAPPATCAPAPLFSDVPCSDPFAPWIEEVARRGIWPGCTGTGTSARYCPTDRVTRDQMAVLLARTFALPVEVRPAFLRMVTNGYDNGYLSSVTGYGTLSYHLNGMVSEVRHNNRVTDTQANDPNGMRRPAALSAAFGSTVRWSSGDYSYDGAGNITKVGDNTWYLYDKVSRLKQGNVALGALGGGAQRNQTYTFDPFGNLTAIAGHSGRNVPANPDTNRLNGTGTVYDTAGNLTGWNGASYEYDSFHQMSRMQSGGEDWRYAYTADGERVWMFNLAANLSRWTLRDLDGKVLREYLNEGGIWSIDRDHLYRDGLLLAAETPEGPRHFHLDYLGTPRLITDRAGRQVSYHAYYPFGEEATAFAQDRERMKFTGHERDLGNAAGVGDDLDYMHARHCSPVTGRFLSVDPASSSGRRAMPQSWNRYSYAAGNPLKYLDPDGREIVLGVGSPAAILEATRLSVRPSLRGAINLGTNREGRRTLTVDNSVRTSDIVFKSIQRTINSPGRVELNVIQPSSPMEFTRRNGPAEVVPRFEMTGLLGLTLPSRGTATRHDQLFSSEPGTTRVFVSGALTPQQQAPVIAAEIGAHALPALLGEGAKPEDEEAHLAREYPFIEAAKNNNQSK